MFSFFCTILFLQSHISPLLREIAEKKVKVISNAGGVNVEACRAALEAACVKAGVSLRIGTVFGDDLLPRVSEFVSCSEMFTGVPFPPKSHITSVNAYLGAGPIAACLAAGCDIVITGRVVDSALVLGPLMHEFAWSADQLQLLAAGTLVGHVLECGAQSTGGLFTDCMDEGIEWSNIGYPIAIVAPNGEFELTKPDNTGGLISVGTVSEQILYEIGDPTDYIVPDVCCDFSNVTIVLTPKGVHVSGARAWGSPNGYKVCATYRDGFKISGMLLLTGQDRADARAKARATGEALIRRITREHPSATISSMFEYFGEERVILKLTIKSNSYAVLSLFGAEFASPATSMAPGTAFLSGGKPRPVELIRLFSFLVDKDRVEPKIVLWNKQTESVKTLVYHSLHERLGKSILTAHSGAAIQSNHRVRAPLSWLCYARSGDKGDNINLALIARHPLILEIIKRRVLPENILHHFREFNPSRCDRFEAPGLHALNFLLHNTLAGGGMASMLSDSLGKGFGQQLLRMRIPLKLDEWSLLVNVGFKTCSLRWEPEKGTITLCNGKGHNTLSNGLVRDLQRVITMLENANFARLVVIRAEGKSFCAGAALNEFSETVDNVSSAVIFASLFRRLNTLPLIVCAVVEGNCVGGGMGLVSCCDWVVATDKARFGLPELKIGMVPATIYPFVAARVGAANMRRLTLTAGDISVVDALGMGLVDEHVSDVAAALARLAAKAQRMGPRAVALAKTKLVAVPREVLTEQYTGELLAAVRVSPEVAEGVNAMKQRRLPEWAKL